MYNVFKTVFNLILAYILNLLPELYNRRVHLLLAMVNSSRRLKI